MILYCAVPGVHPGATLAVKSPNNRSWCEKGDSNPHGCPLDPKSSASANSAILAQLE
jgi:hypothetical protein